MARSPLTILRKNHDLQQRMQQQRWSVYYDELSDMLFISSRDSDTGTHYIPVGGDGLLLRINQKGLIVGLAFEEYSYFLKSHPTSPVISEESLPSIEVARKWLLSSTQMPLDIYKTATALVLNSV